MRRGLLSIAVCSTLFALVGGPAAAQLMPLVNWSNSCDLPWGGVLDGGSNVTAYSQTLPAGVCSSFSETRSCAGRTLSGSYTNQSCTNGCTGTPWGNVSSGYSNTAYSASQVACGSSCASVAETRTCADGVMSGSYTHASCSMATCTWTLAGISCDSGMGPHCTTGEGTPCDVPGQYCFFVESAPQGAGPCPDIFHYLVILRCQ